MSLVSPKERGVGVIYPKSFNVTEHIMDSIYCYYVKHRQDCKTHSSKIELHNKGQNGTWKKGNKIVPKSSKKKKRTRKKQ